MSTLQAIKTPLPVVSINAKPFWYVKSYTIQAEQKIQYNAELYAEKYTSLSKSMPQYSIQLNKMQPISKIAEKDSPLYSLNHFSLQIAEANKTYAFSDCIWESLTESYEINNTPTIYLKIRALSMDLTE